jgi:nitrogen fixation protein FixH
MSAEASRAAHPPRAWIWPLIVVALLVGQVVLLVVTALLATRDPTFAVEPNYYQQGLHWNDAAAQRRENAELGWTATLALGDRLGTLGERDVSLTLVNRDGTPLDGAKVEIVAFSHAQASARATVTLAPRGGGKYESPLRFRHKGVWEFRVTVTRGPEIFTYREERDVYPPGESRPW